MPRVTITVPENSPQPYRFDLKREVVSIGRNPENDIVVGSGSVSGKHAEMLRVEGGYQLIDAGSTNGIKIDGIRHQQVVLHTEMVVKLGDVEFGFTLNEEELAELASELASESERVVLPAADDYQVDEDEYFESKAVTIGSGFILFALIAIAGAFFYGANARHEKDTGEDLLKAVVNKEDIKNETPTEPQDKAGADSR
jgi:pSer/pThr/pTyr-binding forkhead associated (FHA) protein